MKTNKRKSKSKHWRILIPIGILLILIVGILVFCVSKNKTTYYQVDSRIENVETMHQDYEEVVGWLKVQGTNIDYPIIDFSTVSIDNTG